MSVGGAAVEDSFAEGLPEFQVWPAFPVVLLLVLGEGMNPKGFYPSWC